MPRDYAKTIFDALKQADMQRHVSALPIMHNSLPAEGAEVRFWPVDRCQPEYTVIGNAMVGIFRRNVFTNGSDHWSINEVTHWSPINRTIQINQNKG